MNTRTRKDHPYVSRGGVKLAAALDAAGLSVSRLDCVDLGCNVGGFTDCLLRCGAARVVAIDTGYGALAWKLRTDPRVVVRERTNALYLHEADVQRIRSETEPGEEASGAPAIGLVAIDLGWTRQERAIPAALRWRPGRIITLIKPHYEADAEDERPRASARKQKGRRKSGILTDARAERIARRTLDRMPALGVRVLGCIQSPLRGGAGKRKRGNIEYLAWLEPIRSGDPPRPPLDDDSPAPPVSGV